jgi:RimJ/RimL family protein N-acetyltransferase
MVNDKELMRLHVEALFTLTDTRRLLSVNEPGGAAAPRFFIGWTKDGNAWWFRHDLDAALVEDLNALSRSQPIQLIGGASPSSAAPFIDLLAREGRAPKTWEGPAFSFPSELPDNNLAIRVTSENAEVLEPFLDAWRGDVVAGIPMTAVLEDGKAICVCCSVRITPQAHEAGVETHPDFRGRGYAARAVAAWGRTVRAMERVPLYSTSWENTSSRTLAKKMGLIQFGTDLHIT